MELTTKEQAIIDQVQSDYNKSVKKRKREFILFIKKGNKHNE